MTRSSPSTTALLQGTRCGKLYICRTIYFFYFGTGTVFPVRDFLRKKGMIDGKGIIYNQFYFDGNILKEKYQKYIHSKTQTLKPSYKYGAEDVTRDVSALLSILKKHGLML